ncbi:MAG TPA: pitrilysin family protein [Gammaproteobacteria bacterium]|nr:pitrilysin family protein [Gammaproteobacteria bacterium]
MKALALRMVAFLLVIACFAVAEAQPPPLPAGVQRVTSVEGITEYRLANGLRVLLFRDASKATITVNVTYLVGSVSESYGETGMAHLLEHMLFKGTTKHPEPLMKDLQDHGAQFNGSTDWDRTNYFETFEANDANLEWALGLEADRMVNSKIAKADLDSEMTVVRNEFERGENNPIGVLYQRVLSTAFLWHGYGRSAIGSRSDIENVPIDRLQAFYRRFYQPDNAVLVIAGRFDEAKTLALVAKDFGSIPKPTRTLEQRYTVEPVQDGEREVVVRRVGDVPVLIVAYHAPAGAHADFVPLQLATSVLADEPAGRLYKALVEKGLASDIGLSTLQNKDPAAVLFLAQAKAGGSLDAAREAMFATIDDLKAHPITKEELDRAKNNAMSGFERTMNNSQAVALQLSEWAAIGDWRLMFLDRDRVRSATVEDVQRAALQYLKPSNRTVGLFLPGEPDRAEIPPSPNVAALLEGYKGDAARSEGEEFDATPANIDKRTTRVTLPGGTKLSMLPKETRGDAVNAVIRLNFGDERNLAGMGRVAPMTSQMLMRGTKTRTRQQIEDELAKLQSQLNVGGGGGQVSANIVSTRANLAAVIDIALDVLRNPAFPESELETMRASAIAGLEAAKSEPQTIVARAYARQWNPYPANDVRYTPTIEEERAFLTAVKVKDLRDFHAGFYGASNAEVSVVGDFDAAAVQSQVASKLDGWKSQKAYAEVTSPYPNPPIAPKSQVFETPDKENAVFIAGGPIKIKDSDADYPALVLGNYILGGGASSRLFGRIRGTEGLSYSVGSQLNAPAASDGGRFVVQAIAAPQNADKVEASFRDELAKVLRDGYTDQEIATAKDSWLQARQVGRSQDGALTGSLLNHMHNGRTMAWDADFESKVRALTGAEIRAAMQRHLDAGKMAFMKGGDFKGASSN